MTYCTCSEAKYVEEIALGNMWNIINQFKGRKNSTIYPNVKRHPGDWFICAVCGGKKKAAGQHEALGMDHLLNLFSQGLPANIQQQASLPIKFKSRFCILLYTAIHRYFNISRLMCIVKRKLLVLNCNTVQSGLFTYVKISLSISFLCLYMTAASWCEVNITNWNNYYNYCNRVPNIPLKINKVIVFNDV